MLRCAGRRCIEHECHNEQHIGKRDGLHAYRYWTGWKGEIGMPGTQLYSRNEWNVAVGRSGVVDWLAFQTDLYGDKHGLGIGSSF